MNKNFSSTIVTGRVRLARNLTGYNFASTLTDRNKAKEIINRTYSVICKFANFQLYEMSKTSPLICEQLKERYVISEALKNNTFSGAVAVDQGERLSVMINEEDHIRAQCLVKGGDLLSAYKTLVPLDRWMNNNLRFAKSSKLGYITACPTNLGTGLRASVMMFLPALTRNNMMNAFYEKARDRGLTVRGVFGEGSSSESYLYQVSNEITLSRDEVSIIKDVENYVNEIVSIECVNRKSYYEDNKLTLEDEVMRAYGILNYCKRLSYEEFSSLIASIKFGGFLGILKINEFDALDNLLVSARPASMVMSMRGEGICNTNSEDIDYFRAQYVSNYLKKIVSIN